MPAPVQPPKNTSGSGFTFEEKVVGWYGLLMLCGIPPFREDLGCIQQIALQARVDGWLLDDLVLTLQHGAALHRAALSVKSKTYFGEETAAPEFVRDAWEQLLGVQGATFQEDLDFLGVVTTPLPPRLRTDLEFLRHLSATSPQKDVDARMQVKGFASDARRTLYRSFKCPSNLTLSPAGGGAGARLLSLSLFEEFDFDREDSHNEVEAITRCQALLSSGDRQEARSLWEAVVSELRKARGVAPTITTSGLVGALRERFRLSRWPAHERDWERLHQLSLVSRNHTSTVIGGLHIGMEGRQRALQQALAIHSQVAVIGPSGLGKSAAVKEFSLQEPSVLWVEAADLERSWAEYQGSLGLDHSLNDLLHSGRSPLLVVIDGLDRSYEPRAFQNVAQLLELMRQGHPGSKAVLTATSQEWLRIGPVLLQQGAGDWYDLRFAPAELGDLAPLAAHVPAAAGLLLQRHLAPVLQNLKIVDLIVSRLIIAGVPAPLFVGETTIADWYWESEVNQGPDVLRGELAKQIASIQAQRFITRVPTALITPAYLGEIGALVTGRVLHSAGERLWFGHELLGDWARLRTVVGLPDDQRLTFIAGQVDNPVWHRAIQLYAMRLLEQGQLDSWQQEHHAVRQQAALCGDLFLDALFLTPQPRDYLTQLLPQLTADDGLLFHHLFDRFFVLATLPHPELQRFVTAQEPALAASFAASHRVPELYRWMPLILFAVEHLKALMPLLPAPLTRLARDFLQSAPAGFPGRLEAAQLALEGARVAERSHWSDAQRTAAYQAAFPAIIDLPAEARALLLSLAGRSVPSVAEADDPGVPSIPSRLKAAGRRSYVAMRPARPPWPDGPLRRIDHAFRSALLDPYALLPVLASEPQLACELLLATLIESTEERPDDSWSFREEPVEIERYMDWYPAWWYVGPIHSLFHFSEPEGLDFLLRLVNFATQRWLEQHATPPSFLVRVGAGPRTLPGDEGVYFWHRGHCDGHHAPAYALTVALSSLEKYMYERIEQGQNLSGMFDLLMDQGASAAFIGLLCSVVRFQPSLLKQPTLLNFLLTPQITLLESNRAYIEPRVFPPPMLGGSKVVEAHRAWQQMAHRRRPWLEVLQELFITSAESRTLLQSTVQTWPDPEGDAVPATLRRYLLAIFDEQRYSVTVDEAGKESWIFNPPSEFQATAGESVQVDRLFAWTCRQVLSGDKPLPEAQVLWQTLMDYEAALEDRAGKASFLFPGVSLLMQRHYAWVHEDAQRLAWCRQITLDTVREGEATTWEPSDLMQTHWYTFAGPVLALLIADDASDQEVRSAVATLVTCGDRVAVELLIQKSARQTVCQDAGFERLRHLVLIVGVVRDTLERCVRRTEVPEDRVDAAIAHIQKAQEAFTEGTLSRRRPTLHSLTLRGQQLAQTLSPHSLPSDSSVGTVLPAFVHLLTPTEALTAPEVKSAADEVLEVLESLLPPVRRRDSRRPDHVEYEPPTPEDVRVLKAAGRYGSLMGSVDDAKRFWSPLLALDGAGQEWITPFLSAFAEQVLSLPEVPPEMISVWHALIENVCSQRVHGAEVMQALMGLTLRGCWASRHAGLVAAMRPGFALWADQSLHSPEAHAAFARFLAQPAANPLRTSGLCWLSKASQGQSEYWWRSAARASIDLLQTLWDSNPGAVIGTDLPCFRQLLSELESYRLPQAILLSKALAMGTPN